MADRRFASITTAGALLLALMVVGCGTDPSDDLAAGTTATTAASAASAATCASLDLVSGGFAVGADAPVIDPAAVVLYEWVQPGMTSDVLPVLVVDAQGNAIALDVGSGATRNSYRSSTVAPTAVEQLRECLSGSEFESLAPEYLEDGGKVPGHPERFCGISDQSTHTFVRGPATGTRKSVSVYGLQNPSTGELMEGCDMGHPAAIEELFVATDDLVDALSEGGAPSPPPSEALRPTA